MAHRLHMIADKAAEEPVNSQSGASSQAHCAASLGFHQLMFGSIWNYRMTGTLLERIDI